MEIIRHNISVDPAKYHVVRIGGLIDLGIENPPKHTKTQVFCMLSDPFGELTEREQYKMFIDPFIEQLPEGKKDLDYFLLYYSITDADWVAFDIESLPEPRTWDDLRNATGLDDL